MSKPRIGDVVELVWDDSERLRLGWDKRREYLRVAGSEYRTVGYWLGKSKGMAVLTSSISPGTGSVSDSSATPLGCIKSVRVLARTPKAARKGIK
jgi:hypothetical protein